MRYSDKGDSAVELPRPLNKNSYINGAHEDVHHASNLQGFAVVENWQPSDQKETREGLVHVPVLEGTKPGSSVTFSFNGMPCPQELILPMLFNIRLPCKKFSHRFC